ncbi:Os01g0227600 [Oryza sativa Japonica Group]|uniref:Os01g0227600 protein n=1 Tax=Oryza sativa subsp. japonica TaxID=39947 RepID=A0A0P0V0H8_ORYSJ|nr:Os01g0227600 [Oryza sativa Japonica Group]
MRVMKIFLATSAVRSRSPLKASAATWRREGIRAAGIGGRSDHRGRRRWRPGVGRTSCGGDRWTRTVIGDDVNPGRGRVMGIV